MAKVEIRAVSKTFNKKAFNQAQAVSDLSLTVGDGEFVALLGPTGAGKTTTLRLIAGLEMPDPGSIRIDGRDVTGDAPADRDALHLSTRQLRRLVLQLGFDMEKTRHLLHFGADVGFRYAADRRT